MKKINVMTWGGLIVMLVSPLALMASTSDPEVVKLEFFAKGINPSVSKNLASSCLGGEIAFNINVNTTRTLRVYNPSPRISAFSVQSDVSSQFPNVTESINTCGTELKPLQTCAIEFQTGILPTPDQARVSITGGNVATSYLCFTVIDI